MILIQQKKKQKYENSYFPKYDLVVKFIIQHL